MATSSDMAGGNNPAEQVTQTMKAVSEALKIAGEKTAAGNSELAQCAMKQAEENSNRLLEALRTMAASKSPTEAATFYSRFVTESAQLSARQLMEIGELMAKSSREAWGPVAEAITSAARRSTV